RSEAYFVFPLAQGTPGKQCGLAATGVYQPSLRSPWLAADAVAVQQGKINATMIRSSRKQGSSGFIPGGAGSSSIVPHPHIALVGEKPQIIGHLPLCSTIGRNIYAVALGGVPLRDHNGFADTLI
ncbi:hypothetical protein, partial [Thiolapillus sp.]|uniref:hypothetical protein n=1 Tax=Thiolapillus sp. TaxID=2017437 RepID=UPI003AF84CF9